MYLSSTNIFQSNEDINSLLQLPSFINFDFSKSIPLISSDNSFALFYDDSVLINVDLKTKKIKWYKKFLNNEKISNVQINPDNQITFIKKLNTHNEIITLSNNNMDYNELKLKENILGYKLFENPDKDDPSDMVLVISDLFQITLYKDNILQKSVNRNIMKDVPDESIQVNNKIIKIECLSEQKLILIFFDNGLIVEYSIINDVNENGYENENKIEYVNYIDLNKDEDNKYLYNNISIHINNYICDNQEQKNEIMEIENNSDDNEIENNNNINENIIQKNNLITTFLTLIINQSNINKRKSAVYFFKLENGKFTDFKNRISFDNKEIIDSSIFKYKLNNDENDINDFIFILFKHSNIFNNNRFMYSTEYSDLYHWFDLDKEINEENNKFKIFKIFDEYPNSHIYLNNIILTNNKKRLFNISYIKLGEKVSYFEQNNENLESNNNLNNLDDILKSNNYNDYILYISSPNYDEEEFKEKINNKYKTLYKINLNEEIFNIKNGVDNNEKNDINKINYFILNLIANQALFKIKSYLLKRNALNTNFIFPIDQICLTCKILLKTIKTKINKENEINPDIEKILNILLHLLKIIKNRNRTYNEKLFCGEKEIILEQESIINSMIFDTSMTLFILRILHLYFNIQFNNDDINEKPDYSFFNIFSFNEEKKIIEEIDMKQLYPIFVEIFSEENIKNIFNNNNISLDALLYLIKFIAFNYYFYSIYPNIKNESQCFKNILPEYKEYSEISRALFTFDNNNDDKQSNINIYELIKFLKYISDEKLLINDQLNKILPLNKIIYKLIKSLYELKYINEAFYIGNSLLSAFSTFDEFNIYLIIILELKDYPLAYSFINNCLSVYYKRNLNQDEIKQFFDSENYYELKNLYFKFYEYLIRHKAIDILFKLPLNFVEIYIFKEMCEENEQYKEFLIIYYLIAGNINEAKYQFQRYLNSNSINESQSKTLYANLIKYYETLMNKKNKREKIDDIIEQLSTENKFLVEIDDKKEKEIIDKRINLQKKENIGFSEFMLKSSLMENKILSGLNYSINDYNKFSSNISNKYNNIFNEDISKSILKQEKTNQNNNIININSSKYNIISMDNENSDSDMENNIISTKIKKNSKY